MVNFCYALTKPPYLYDITNSWGTWATKKTNKETNKKTHQKPQTKKTPETYDTASWKTGNQKGLMNTQKCYIRV